VVCERSGGRAQLGCCVGDAGADTDAVADTDADADASCCMGESECV